MSVAPSEGALFAARCIDKAGSGAVRAATRAAHLKWVSDNADHFHFGGPLRPTPRDATLGSLLILRLGSDATVDSVNAILKDDPYVKAGLFESVEVRPWKCGMISDTLPQHMYAVWCIDKPQSMALRKETRPRHLDWWRAAERQGMIGPFPEGDGGVGTLIICEGQSVDEVAQWANTDPYAEAELFESVSVQGVSKIIMHGKMLTQV